MKTVVLTIDTPADFAIALREAAQQLRAGELVAVPTETVYGLAANALRADAVAKIYAVKGRPAHNPIIVHVRSLAMARDCAVSWPPVAEKLAQAFWPGPMTLVLPRAAAVPDLVAAGGKTIGIRWPAHPFMQALIAECGFPLAAPSANLANQVSPTTAAHVRAALDGRIPLIVDAGPAAVGIESTVVDVTVEPPVVLRPGMISAAAIGAALKTPISGRGGASHDPALRSPGLLARHYSPRARLQLASWESDRSLEQLAGASGLPLERIHIIAWNRIPRQGRFGRVAVIPEDAEAYARALYAELHTGDELGAALILVENPPETTEWEGIRDRLRRAATPR
jgi:L-threonylcarbamoyladenylate synthase